MWQIYLFWKIDKFSKKVNRPNLGPSKVDEAKVHIQYKKMPPLNLLDLNTNMIEIASYDPQEKVMGRDCDFASNPLGLLKIGKTSTSPRGATLTLGDQSYGSASRRHRELALGAVVFFSLPGTVPFFFCSLTGTGSQGLRPLDDADILGASTALRTFGPRFICKSSADYSKHTESHTKSFKNM